MLEALEPVAVPTPSQPPALRESQLPKGIFSASSTSGAAVMPPVSTVMPVAWSAANTRSAGCAQPGRCRGLAKQCHKSLDERQRWLVSKQLGEPGSAPRRRGVIIHVTLAA